MHRYFPPASRPDEVSSRTIAGERERIARDLHDGCAQDLASAIKRVELCEKLVRADPEEAVRELRILKESARDILNEIRRAIFDIAPQEGSRGGIRERLRAYLEDYEKLHDISVKIAGADSLDDIPAEKCGPVFCIIREALTNAGKHSRAKKIALTISSSADGAKVVIKDDGCGFDAGAENMALRAGRGKYGLAGMYQRAEALGGTLSVRSICDEGCEIGLEVPFV